MPLFDRRQEYSWPATKLESVQLLPEQKEYSLDDVLILNLGFRIVGGAREAFNPDVWTVAWEDFDKTLRLTARTAISAARSPFAKRLTEPQKEVRKASFYWSRDPDLPYRIWPLIVPEDGGPPKIPLNVEDAKTQMFDFVKHFELAGNSLGRGSHRIAASVAVKWGRHSYIEKGEVEGRSRPVVVRIE
jgi:hypothetical protein